MRRPAREPHILKALAAKRGVSCVQLLADVLGKHATDVDAAAELGCHPESVRLWKRRYADQLEVVR